jgi:guanylate kinase
MPEGNRPARGKLIVISAPSGSGKTSIAKEIMRRNPSLTFSVSATTRSRREGESEGKDYFFLTKDEFKRRVVAGEFVEWEEIYGDYYGTLRKEVDRALLGGQHIVFDVDVKGGVSIKREYPETLVVFIQLPSVGALRERLQHRHTEDEATIARRMERVPMEMEIGKQFEHQVVNDDLSRAIDEVQTIVKQYLDQ